MTTQRRSEPAPTLSDPKRLLSDYLDYYRLVVLDKLAGLTEEELRGSRLPTGWTPLQLLWHLGHVEHRWLVWGFLGEEVPDPWGDHDADGHWAVPDGMTTAEIMRWFRDQCGRSREIVEAAGLTEAGAAVRGRFAGAEEAPTLAWILFHLLQEYARHAGHLDIVRELADGATGE